MAVGVGRLRGEHFVVAGDQADLDARDGCGARERAHEHMHAVVAREGGETEVGDHEPLRRAPVVVVLVALAGARGVPGGRAVMT